MIFLLDFLKNLVSWFCPDSTICFWDFSEIVLRFCLCIFIYVSCNSHSWLIYERMYVSFIYWASRTPWLIICYIFEHLTHSRLKILCILVTESNFSNSSFRLRSIFLLNLAFHSWILICFHAFYRFLHSQADLELISLLGCISCWFLFISDFHRSLIKFCLPTPEFKLNFEI